MSINEEVKLLRRAVVLMIQGWDFLNSGPEAELWEIMRKLQADEREAGQ